MKTTIYRTGQMTRATHGEDLLQHWAEFDVRRPAGHVGRLEALFGAPDLQGGHEWLNYSAVRTPLNSSAFAFNEITVESDNLRVYFVDDYDSVGFHYGNPSKWQVAYIEDYWKNSMTLTQWIKDVGEDPYGRWEVLLPEKEVIASRTLTYPELREMYEDWGMDDERMQELATNVRLRLEYDNDNPFLSLSAALQGS